MKVRVTIDAQTFDVEVGDLHARPILVTVEGDTFLVYPEQNDGQAAEAKEAVQPSSLAAAESNGKSGNDHLAPASRAPVTTAAATTPPAIVPAAGNSKQVLAPIPGVILAVHVKEGEAVRFGQDLCTLEAMKMKNVIRANRAAKVAAIHVAAGDQVKRSQVLVEYTD